MRLYEYECPVCGYKCEEFVNNIADVVNCQRCDSKMKKLISNSKYRIKAGDFFEPYVDTNIHPDGDPIKIESREQFKAECRKHGKGWRPIKDKMK